MLMVLWDSKGTADPKDCAGVILYAAEKATEISLDAIQCLGGNGYTNDYPVGRIMRDAKLYEIGASALHAGRSTLHRRFAPRGGAPRVVVVLFLY